MVVCQFLHPVIKGPVTSRLLQTVAYHRGVALKVSVVLERCLWWRCWWRHTCSFPRRRVLLWQCKGCLSSGRQSVSCPGRQTMGTHWRSMWSSALWTKSDVAAHVRTSALHKTHTAHTVTPPHRLCSSSEMNVFCFFFWFILHVMTAELHGITEDPWCMVQYQQKYGYLVTATPSPPLTSCFFSQDGIE